MKNKWFRAEVIESPLHPDKKIIRPILTIHSHHKSGCGRVVDKVDDPLEHFKSGQFVLVISEEELGQADWDQLLKGLRVGIKRCQNDKYIEPLPPPDPGQRMG